MSDFYNPVNNIYKNRLDVFNDVMLWGDYNGHVRGDKPNPLGYRRKKDLRHSFLCKKGLRTKDLRAKKD